MGPIPKKKIHTKTLQNKRRKCYKCGENCHFGNERKNDDNVTSKMNVKGITSKSNIQMTIKPNTFISELILNAKKASEPTKMWVLKKD